MVNSLSIDVEEYFHPEEIQRSMDIRQWDVLPSRAAAETDRILEILDRHSVRATFFILGWVADRQPQLLQRIVGAGHEIGCHSYFHQLVYTLTPEQFRADTEQAIAAIQNACGVTPRLYRAPSYSITAQSLWALEILVECGFHFDSSIFPITHDRYGIPGFKRHAHVLQTASGPIIEVPVATTQLPNRAIVPVGGGGYLRLLPYRYTAAGIRRLNSRESQPACIYFHPWELDAEQPRIASGSISRLRTYAGLRGMEKKLDRLLTDFRFCPLGAVHGCIHQPVVGKELKTAAAAPAGVTFPA